MLLRLSMTLLIAAGSAGVAEAAIVRFKNSATVSSAVVRLADVADVADADPDAMQRLGEITLAPAPAPGGEILLDFATIRGRLQAHGVDLSRLEFSGSSSVKVQSPPPPPEPAAPRSPAPQPAVRSEITDWQIRRAETLVAEAVRQHVAAAAPQLGRVNVEVRLDREDVPRVLSLAAAGLVADGGNGPWDAWHTVSIRPKGRSAESVDEFQVRSRVSQKPFVIAAKYAVPRGHILKPEDLVWRQVEQTEGVASRPEDVIGRETSRTFRPDEPIDPAGIQTVPLIRSNDIVTVYARQPGVTVKRLMKARGDGSAGDQVTVVTLDGRQQIVARVTGYHEAEAVGSMGAEASHVRFVPTAEAPSGVRPAGFTREEGTRR
ncbi:MAG: flagellar basal body P-ring formation chaperone FlgA [Planctomycetales bacterium]